MLLLVSRVAAAPTEARTSGKGQVVDAAMTDGSALLMTMMYTLKAMWASSRPRGSNLLDGGAHFTTHLPLCRRQLLPSAPSSPSSTRSSCRRPASPIRDFSQQWDRARWPEFQDPRRRPFPPPARGTNGAVLMEAATAWRSVLDMDEAPGTPAIIGPAAPSSKLAASFSRRRLPASLQQFPATPARRGGRRHGRRRVSQISFTPTPSIGLRRAGAI